MLVSDICADGSNGNEQTTLLRNAIACPQTRRRLEQPGVCITRHHFSDTQLQKEASCKGGSAELTCHASLPLKDYRFESVRVISVWLLH